MPIIDDVGHSDYTVPKMEVLSSIFDMHFMITQAVIKNINHTGKNTDMWI